MRRTIYLSLIVIGAATGCLMVLKMTRPAPQPVSATKKAISLPKTDEGLRRFVQQKASSKIPETQDLVSAANIRLAYSAAKRKDWHDARETFTRAAAIPGTGEMSPEWGSLSDQAAYQAIVCLVAEKKTEEARTEFIRFLKDRPLSPLVHACYQRLVRLNGGETTTEYDNLLQAAVSKQEANIRFETSVCGPKTIEYLVQAKAISASANTQTDYKTLAKICGTTDTGTTIDGMRKGLRELGIQSFAYRLNRKDLTRISLPAILLEGDHYVALLKVGASSYFCYDTRFKGEQERRLPPIEDPDFSANAIVFSSLEEAQ